MFDRCSCVRDLDYLETLVTADDRQTVEAIHIAVGVAVTTIEFEHEDPIVGDHEEGPKRSHSESPETLA